MKTNKIKYFATFDNDFKEVFEKGLINFRGLKVRGLLAIISKFDTVAKA